jgi:hypothetical protein
VRVSEPPSDIWRKASEETNTYNIDTAAIAIGLPVTVGDRRRYQEFLSQQYTYQYYGCISGMKTPGSVPETFHGGSLERTLISIARPIWHLL